MQTTPGKANKKEDSCLVLASSSPRRRELLEQTGVKFIVHSSSMKEIKFHDDGPEKLVMENARIKTLKVSKSFPNHFVLGADTTVFLNDRVFGKPENLVEARRMLLDLSGKTHSVSTGVCFCRKQFNYLETRVESSAVTFKDLNDSAIDDYLEKINPLDKAGGYAMQTRPDLIIEEFTGSRTNIIGLPMELLNLWFSELRTLFPMNFP